MVKEHKNIFIINKKKGVLIVYEGISGCGKSENIRKCSLDLFDKGFTPKVVEWNSNDTIRRFTKWLLSKKKLTPRIYSFLQWIAFFIDYTVKIKPYLNKGHIVLADRYVYTGLTREKLNGSSRGFRYWILHLVREPDIVFFFDIQPQICYERIILRGKHLFHTNKRILNNRLLKNRELYYLIKLRAEYLRLIKDPALLKNTNVVVLNNDFELLSQKIISYLKVKKCR